MDSGSSRVMANRIKLSEVIKIWDLIHVKDIGELNYCDLYNAVEKVVGEVENDCRTLEEIQARHKKEDEHEA